MKQKRQLRIIEIINQNAIETQEELALKLREEGFEVTQATVSRDIRELNLSKVPGPDGRQKYAILSSGGPLNDKYVRVMHDGLLSMEPAGNLLVLKTVSGMAMAVAAAVDAMHFPEIVGSIAGDDTIMAATKSNQEAANLKNKIIDLIH
jgi:transcriptional regulator of arginine metabolism